MQLFKIQKVISVICSVLGIILASFGLIVSLLSIGAEGFGRLGVIFIVPSLLALFIIILDFLIVIGKIRKGLIYSWISCLVKIGVIIFFIPDTIYEFKYELQYGMSNLYFNLMVIFLLVIITIPSVFNIIKLNYLKKSNE